MEDTIFNVNEEQLEVVVSRIFKTTKERLWSAITIPEQISQWWGPADYSTEVEKNDVRVGGAWRFVQTTKDGKIHAFRGDYKEVKEPTKLVRSFEYEPMAGHVLIETMEFESQSDGSTKMTATAKYSSLDDLRGMVDMDMESGERESFDRLAKLLGE